MRRRKRLKWLGVFALCAAVALCAGGCGEPHPSTLFPRWDPAVDMEVNPDVALEFQGIDFGTYALEDGKLLYDEVLVHLSTKKGGNASRYHEYWVEYLYKGDWYIVYSFPQDGQMAEFYPLEADLSFLVPSGLFSLPGQYRLYLRRTGYCDMDILFNPNDVS